MRSHGDKGKSAKHLVDGTMGGTSQGTAAKRDRRYPEGRLVGVAGEKRRPAGVLVRRYLGGGAGQGGGGGL